MSPYLIALVGSGLVSAFARELARFTESWRARTGRRPLGAAKAGSENVELYVRQPDGAYQILAEGDLSAESVDRLITEIQNEG
jgi:hypothetical protein